MTRSFREVGTSAVVALTALFAAAALALLQLKGLGLVGWGAWVLAAVVLAWLLVWGVHRGRARVRAQYRELLDSVRDYALVALDPEGRIASWNPGAERQFGYQAEQVLGQSAARLRPEANAADRHRTLLQEAQRSGRAEQKGFQRRRDGSAFFADILITPLRGRWGRLDGYSMLTRDVTERQRAEEGLRFLVQASTLLSSSLDYDTTLARVARLAVFSLADWCLVELEDQDGHLRTVAAAHADPEKDRLAQRLLGRHALSAAAAERPPILGLREPELLTNPQALVSELAASPDEARVVEALGCRSAMVVPLLARGRAIGAILLVSSREGHVYGPEDVKLAEDLARRCATAVDNAALYGEAQEAIRARDEFLSIASHELKTPLTSLRLQLQALRRAVMRTDAGEAPALFGRLEAADRQIRHLAELTDELLDISRIRLGRLELAPQALDLAALVRDVVGRFQQGLPPDASPIHLHADVPVVGRWDRLRMEQVVTNLLSNAVKYGNGQPIELRVAQEGGRALLSVQDHGIGIALDHQVRIFERFERAVPARHFGGLGLGLYIVRQIVEAHGGQIRLQSRPGQGSTFTVELPEQAVPAERTPSSVLA